MITIVMLVRIKWKICVWAFIVIASAVAVSRVVNALNGTPDSFSQTDEKFQNVNSAPLADQFTNLFWFIQISDIHLSIFHSQSRITEFRDFCLHSVPIISPSVVLASGDLTDAKSKNGMGSQQYVEEWNHYMNILNESQLDNTSFWLDVRGNHDNFNIRSLNSPENMFDTHSVQGRKHRRSYLHSTTLAGNKVAFVAVDATPLPGPKRPFNFVGLMPPSEYGLLESLSEEAEKHDYSVWFGHYPTSCILGPDQDVHDVRNLMRKGVVYLCGHLHSLGGLVPSMYTRQTNGLLELELEDWKDGRMFRVMAIDNGQFSFSDVKHNKWPVIVLTNPKQSLFLNPNSEPLSVMQKSTHIRALVWSMSPLKSVSYKIDGKEWLQMDNIQGPLYVAKWNPSQYLEGSHSITIIAVDDLGNEQVLDQVFSLDGTQESLRLWPRIFLMSNVSSVLQLLFGCSLLVTVSTLCIIKYLHYTVAKTNAQNICRNGIFRIRIIRRLLRMVWLMCASDAIFWPLVFYLLYLPFGPWVAGEFLDNKYGVVFSWGLFVNGSFLPGSLTYAYGFVLIVFYIIPLILGISYSVDCKVRKLFFQNETGFFWQGIKNLPISLPILLQSAFTYLMFLAYGWVSIFFGPIRSYSVILGLYLWYQSRNLSYMKMRRAVEMWFGDLDRGGDKRMSELLSDLAPTFSNKPRRNISGTKSISGNFGDSSSPKDGSPSHNLNEL